MKKSFVLLLAFILLISGTACYAQNQLLKEKDQVHFEENVIYGDKSVVDGVTVETDISYGYHLFWHTTYEIGAEEKEKTEYTFYPWGHLEANYKNAGSLDFIADCTDAMGDDYEEDKDYQGLEKAMKELYDQTEAGTGSVRTVYLKDYMDYYTFGLELMLPHDSAVANLNYYEYGYLLESEIKSQITYLEEHGSDTEELAKWKRYLADLESFQEFFKIPVLDTEVYNLAILKDENGQVVGMAESATYWGSATGEIDIPDAPDVEGADSFSFRVWSAFGDGDCYMTFDPHTEGNQLVDVSQIPGGYGIYHFTYDEEERTINLDDLKMVYPMDAKDYISEMTLDTSGENILLFTYDEEYLYMSVIDRETLTLVDRFTIGNIEAGLSYWCYEDYLVISTENLMVFPLGENGRYAQAFSINEEKMEKLIGANEYTRDILDWGTVFDWDGKTLIFSNGANRYDKDTLRVQWSCDFYVAAVDETGLLYYGEYECSLDTSDVNYNPCSFNTDIDESIRISWN